MAGSFIHRYAAYVFLVFFAMLGNRSAVAEIRGDVAQIDRACVAFETNIAKLRTWVAEIEVRDRSSRPPSPGLFTSQSQRDLVTMSYDRDFPAFMVRWRCVESTAIDDSKERPGWNDSREWGEMMVDESFYKITIYDPREGLTRPWPEYSNRSTAAPKAGGSIRTTYRSS